MDMILHIAKRDDWDQAQASGSYRADTLDSQGFIHCSTPDQVVGVANALFSGQQDLVLLCIDSGKVKVEIRYENLEGGSELFPHLYGPLHLEAVADVLDFAPQADGTFVLPKKLLPLKLARDVATRYAALPQVEAIALGGSLASGASDPGSDIDLYVYSHRDVSLQERARIAQTGASYAEVDNRFWEPGDEWVDAATGIHIDVMFRPVEWIEEQLDRVIRRHEASVGYSTCFWHNVASSSVLYDRTGWYTELKRTAMQTVPEPLRRAIVAKNHPILRETASSYHYQLRRAVARGDSVSINHRVAAILASYFDILFAVNRKLHPGEKRLLDIAATECTRIPTGMREQVEAVIAAVPKGQAVIERVDELIDGLDELLRSEGMFDRPLPGVTPGAESPGPGPRKIRSPGRQ